MGLDTNRLDQRAGSSSGTDGGEFPNTGVLSGLTPAARQWGDRGLGYCVEPRP
jgi:hypothetical protein